MKPNFNEFPVENWRWHSKNDCLIDLLLRDNKTGDFYTCIIGVADWDSYIDDYVQQGIEYYGHSAKEVGLKKYDGEPDDFLDEVTR